MKFTKKVVKYGKSMYVNIPKNVIETAKLEYNKKYTFEIIPEEQNVEMQ